MVGDKRNDLGTNKIDVNSDGHEARPFGHDFIFGLERP